MLFMSRMVSSVMLGLYKSLVKPHIEYCSQAWAPMARHGNWSLILELEGVQRSFTRMIDGLGLMTYRERLDNLKLTTLLERSSKINFSTSTNLVKSTLKSELLSIQSRYDEIDWCELSKTKFYSVN